MSRCDAVITAGRLAADASSFCELKTGIRLRLEILTVLCFVRLRISSNRAFAIRVRCGCDPIVASAGSIVGGSVVNGPRRSVGTEGFCELKTALYRRLKILRVLLFL